MFSIQSIRNQIFTLLHCQIFPEKTKLFFQRISQAVLTPFLWISGLFQKSTFCLWLKNKNCSVKMETKSEEILKQEYQTLVEESKNICKVIDKHTLFKTALTVENQKRNRYPNILPNEATRVTFPGNPDFYFNANWVLDKTAIACQGPLQEEVEEFWKMVWQTKGQTIVMLTNLLEQGKIKCSSYWEDSNQCSSFTIDCLSEEILFTAEKNVKIVERKIQISMGNEKRSISQLQLQNWPDFGVVSPDVLVKLIELVEEKNPENGPLLVHCSAGVGRTGTFLAAFEAKRKSTTNIFPIVSSLRHPITGRIGMVQKPEQYILAYRTAQMFKNR